MSAARPEHRRQALPREAGFTMIEALVTFVVLAIGVLGIVTLMTTSKTAQHEAAQRARAVTMADGILERIRENPQAVNSYLRALDNPLGGGTITPAPPDPFTTPPADPNDVPAAVATYDLWAWEQQLDGAGVTVGGASTPSAGLREARGCITFNPFHGRANTGDLTVLLQWQGLHETSDGVPAGGAACGGSAPDSDLFRRQISVSSFVTLSRED